MEAGYFFFRFLLYFSDLTIFTPISAINQTSDNQFLKEKYNLPLARIVWGEKNNFCNEILLKWKPDIFSSIFFCISLTSLYLPQSLPLTKQVITHFWRRNIICRSQELSGGEKKNFCNKILLKWKPELCGRYGNHTTTCRAVESLLPIARINSVTHLVFYRMGTGSVSSAGKGGRGVRLITNHDILSGLIS